MTGDWLAGGRVELAGERILDAVRTLVIDLGAGTVGMAQVAEAAGCSRATLYRYFANRQALYVAFAGREAAQLLARVWRDRPLDGPDRAELLLDGMTATLAEVRRTPHLAVWFEPANVGIVARLSDSSEVIDELVAVFVARLRPELSAAAAHRLGGWAIRVMISLLTLPLPSDDEERALLRDFLLPFLSESGLAVPPS
ncbi:TetR/AcrR family transcriptional regulator [Nocardia sp. NBC_01329]|uniref:TetR/AcrR family transcriptional regulator n=1 Tax=Nocardia sp. NBC_01329 TaxID=2903594 RepID=UPI002E1222B6|nr:TetR/AcrR family transcriptional regulator [Nocardia sp. NBC_01329]